jgi:Uma2 family endonuclease
MIAAPEPFPTLTPEEYLVWEEQQLEKHEYIHGQIYELHRPKCSEVQANSINHDQICDQLAILLKSHWMESPWILGNANTTVRIPGTQIDLGADYSVTCDDRDKTTTQYITYPCLIVEVLSKSTESYDRGGKFRLYCQNPVLQDYLLVSSTSIEVDLYHKNEAGDWLILNYQAGDEIELKSIGLKFAIDELYRGLVLTPEV